MSAHRDHPMLLLAGIVLALLVVVIIWRLRVPDADDLGWMSARWLAQHRASRSGQDSSRRQPW